MSERAIQNGYLIVAQQEIDELRRQKAALVGALDTMITLSKAGLFETPSTMDPLHAQAAKHAITHAEDVLASAIGLAKETA